MPLVSEPYYLVFRPGYGGGCWQQMRRAGGGDAL